MKKLVLSFCVACSLVTAHAAVYVFDAPLSGLNEFPANNSTGVGYTLVNYDDVANTLRVQVLFARLLGTTTAAHIHAATALPGQGTAGVATTVPSFPSFPIGGTFGSYDYTLNLTSASSYNSAFIAANGGTTAGAQAALVSAMFAGTSYLNIHSTAFPGGEVRGFLTLVPEPSTFAMLALGGACVAMKSRKKLAARL
ncbi:MAG TPA: CHRD domain-containing protein [Candidatus Paceibacterota bacterium]|nr:CHRD domain-containing protein [Candidatus Paceibacterota bacterium]